MNLTEVLNNISDDFFKYTDDEEVQRLLNSNLIDKSVMECRWLGFKPSTLVDIKSRERFLGCSLPPSYKDFLLTSNGFRYTSRFLDNLLPIEKVDWVKNTEEPWFFENIEKYKIEVSDEEYFVYGEDQDTAYCRDEYLIQSIKVSQWYDGMCIFLNPVIKFGEEWEVLQYATWYPGTARYKSFKEFLIAEHESNLNLINGE